MNAAQQRRYHQLRDGADRAIMAIGASDLETLLATLGMALTAALCVLETPKREAEALKWMHQLAVSLAEAEAHEEPHGRSVH